MTDGVLMGSPVYPYRQKDGYRSILRARDMDDARQWLTGFCGHGVLFCEAKMDDAGVDEIIYAEDKDARIDNLLAERPNFVT